MSQLKLFVCSKRQHLILKNGRLKAVKKVLALKKALKNADPEQKAAIKAKLAKAKRVLAKANKKVARVAPKKSIKAKIAAEIKETALAKQRLFE